MSSTNVPIHDSGGTGPIVALQQIILRMYYPTPGNDPPSILPYQSGSIRLPESYIPPVLKQIS